MCRVSGCTSCSCTSGRIGVPVEIRDVVRCRTSRLRDVVDVVEVVRRFLRPSNFTSILRVEVVEQQQQQLEVSQHYGEVPLCVSQRNLR